MSFLASLFLFSGCAGGYRVVPAAAPFSPAALGVSWLTPSEGSDSRTLARWRAAVGQPLVSASPAQSTTAIDELTIVSWNIALGEGDVLGLVRRLREEQPRTPIVLLLQEAYRGGDDVPASPLEAAFGRRLRTAPGLEIDDLARVLGMSLYYVPSMRNGPPGAALEDRGNAILSTLPLSSLTAIELPFERQRRVAISASLSGTTSSGGPWTLKVGNVHLDNTSGMNRLWVGSEFARMRQARALRDAFRGGEPTVLAGDFNTWFGFQDGAYREIKGVFPQTKVTDKRRTFMGLMRLDHLFYRVPANWEVRFRRSDSAFGSDHHPLIARVRLGENNKTGD